MKQIEKPVVEHRTFEEELERIGAIVYTNTGYSMMPLLRQHRDIIEIRRKEQGRCRKYDVVLYKCGDKYILHRILKVLPTGYVIAGDHNTFLENGITDDMILGVMTKLHRDGKTITPDNFWYKIYVHLWCDMYPVRMLILKVKWKIRSFVYRCLSYVKRRAIKLNKN